MSSWKKLTRTPLIQDNIKDRAPGHMTGTCGTWTSDSKTPHSVLESKTEQHQ